MHRKGNQIMDKGLTRRIGGGIRFSCRHYQGDRPCRLSKETGVKCTHCDGFAPMGEKILIIKLGAPGDVLRTTPLLHEIRLRFPDAFITWITERNSFPLLEGNPFIDRLWDTGEETMARLGIESFDLVMSLENAGKCASLAVLVNAENKLGYGISPEGWLVPFNKEAETYLEMAVFDEVKKANTRTYQELIFEVCGFTFTPDIHRIILPLTAEELEFATAFAERNRIRPGEALVGINIGSGGRWPMKRWLTSRYGELIERLVDETDCKVVLLGGPEEKERSRELRNFLACKEVIVIDGRCDNPLRQFIALVSLCDIVVTGDTLAMHIAVALEKQVVALFGPTSATEIELYGRGAAIVAPVPCQCCYRKECDVSPNCMESISVDMVMDRIMQLQTDTQCPAGMVSNL